MFVADTNVLIYAADPDSEFHESCRGLIERWRKQAAPWYVTWSIGYEFLRVCTHPRVFRRPWTLVQGWSFLAMILESPTGGLLHPTARHADILRSVIGEVSHLRGNILHDVHTAVLMREHGIKEIYTLDQDFHRFPFLQVIDPLS